VLAEMGAKPSQAFARTGVRLRDFRNPESRVSFESLGHLLVKCAALTRCDHFGLLVGERFDMTGLGAVGALMRNSATVGDALRALLRHLYLYDRGAAPLLLNSDSSTALLGYSIYRRETRGAVQIYGAAIAIGLRILQAICGTAWAPVRVQFAHERPRNLRAYRRVFGQHLTFDAPVSGVVFAATWLQKPIPGADGEIRRTVEAAMQTARIAGAIRFSDEVRSALPQLVLNGNASADEVSLLFGINQRTLRKRLAAENINLHALVGEVRFELAAQLLKNTHLPMAEIAAALHYADPAVFSRAFRQWTNSSPLRWRKQQ